MPPATSSKFIALDSLSEKLKCSRWASVWEGWNEISSLCPEVTPISAVGQGSFNLNDFQSHELFEGHMCVFYHWSTVSPQPQGHGVLCLHWRLAFREQVLGGTWPAR